MRRKQGQVREGSGKLDHSGLWRQSSGALSLGDGAECALDTWALSTEDQPKTRWDRTSFFFLHHHYFLSTFYMPSPVLGSRDPKVD